MKDSLEIVSSRSTHRIFIIDNLYVYSFMDRQNNMFIINIGGRRFLLFNVNGYNISIMFEGVSVSMLLYTSW